MNPMFAVLALALTVVSGQRGRASNGYGAPPAAAPQPQYNQQPAAQEPQAQYGQQAQASSLSESQHGGDHQGLDWLLESVPGQPGTDYPIYADASQFDFDCNGQTQGYYADPAAQCQAFHVCLETDQPGVLRAESFLCPNGTIFNQEYLICDWWFNFDCSQAQSLYSVNDQIEAERQQATKSQANNNNNNNYTPSNGNNNNNFNTNNNNNNFGSASNNNNNYASPAQATYGGK